MIRVIKVAPMAQTMSLAFGTPPCGTDCLSLLGPPPPCGTDCVSLLGPTVFLYLLISYANVRKPPFWSVKTLTWVGSVSDSKWS